MLNVGILLNTTEVPAWQHAVAESIATNSNPTFITIDKSICVPRPPIGKLYKVFQDFDSSRRVVGPDALELKSITPLVKDLHPLHISACDLADPRSGFDALKNKQLDVIIALVLPTCPETFSQLSKYGLWFYWHDFGQTPATDGSTAGFWEVLKRCPFMHSALLICRGSGRRRLVAYDTYSAVHCSSHNQTRNEHLWKISKFPLRAMKRLDAGGSAFLNQSPRLSDGEWPIIQEKFSRLSNRSIGRALVSYMAREVVNKFLRNRHRERWVLLLGQSRATFDPTTLEALLPPPGRFWADPDIISRSGQTCLFFEDASCESGKGHISLIQISDKGELSAPIPILRKPYHLSYPYVFEWEDEVYLVPESAENRTVELYRFTTFPTKLEYVHNLMTDIDAYDATIFPHGESWWLFANVKHHAGASTWDELCIYFSDSPISRRWHAHPLNPVISDVRRARPAGHVYSDQGRLYRPSQDSSFRYGYGLNINRIIELTKESYREELIRRIEPKWSPKILASHTFNRCRTLVASDAIYRS